MLENSEDSDHGWNRWQRQHWGREWVMGQGLQLPSSGGNGVRLSISDGKSGMLNMVQAQKGKKDWKFVDEAASLDTWSLKTQVLVLDGLKVAGGIHPRISSSLNCAHLLSWNPVEPGFCSEVGFRARKKLQAIRDIPRKLAHATEMHWNVYGAGLTAGQVKGSEWKATGHVQRKRRNTP